MGMVKAFALLRLVRSFSSVSCRKNQQRYAAALRQNGKPLGRHETLTRQEHEHREPN